MFRENYISIDINTHPLLQVQDDKNHYIHSDRDAWAYPLFHLLVFIMVLRIAFFTRQRFVGDYATIDIYNLVNIVITFAIIAILLVRLQDVILLIRNSGTAVRCIIFYYAFCAFVGLLSPSTGYAVFRASEFLACFLAIMLIVSRYSNFFKAERVVLIWVSLILVIDFAGHIRLSGWGNFHATRYSITAALLFAYSFGEFASAAGRRKQLLIVLLAIGLGGVLLGTSTGTNISLAGGLIVLFILSSRHRRYILIAVPVLILAIGWDSLLGIILGGKTREQVVNLDHRIGIWEIGWDLFTKRPCLGYGLNVATREYSQNLSSHNAYLESLLAGGILGAGVLFFGCLALLRDLLRSVKSRSYGSLGCCVATIVYLINGASAPTIGYVLTPANISFAFILALFIYHVRFSIKRTIEPKEITSAQWSQISQLHVYRKDPEPSAEVP